jgi:hypothetical protein
MILDLFRKEIEFNNIQGYEDLKDIVRRALGAEDNYNLLLIGAPASAKTLFLLGILEYRRGVYFDGSNTTNRILDVLEEKRPKIICIDELDKMHRTREKHEILTIEPSSAASKLVGHEMRAYLWSELIMFSALHLPFCISFIHGISRVLSITQ